MHLEIGFCEYYFVQMTFLHPGIIGRSSWGKEHPFLTEFVLFMNSCFIRYNAPLVVFVNLAQEINLFRQKWLVFCHFQIKFTIFEVQTVSVTAIFNLSVSVWKFTHTFLLPVYIGHFRRDICSLESVFSMSGNCCISNTVSVSFLGEDFGVLSTTWKSPNFDFNLRKTFFISNVPTHLDSNRKRKIKSKQMKLFRNYLL